MGYDAFGLFRGWCTRASSCLEYVAAGEPTDPADPTPMRCSRCRCLPQEHVPAIAEGYDPNSAEHLAERRKHDVRLLPPEERAAVFKGRADAAFKERNYRTAYLEYTRAIEATPDNHILLGNRCQTYLKVGKVEAALTDAERAVALAPDWAKGHYRHGMSLQANERFADAVNAFQKAVDLDGTNSEARKALDVALVKRNEYDEHQVKLAKARKRTTIRQAADQYEEEKFSAKQRAKKEGKIKEITEWGGELAEKWEEEYRANIRPPAGVEYALTYNGKDDESDDEDRIVELEENAEEGDDEGGGLALELEENDEEDGDGGAMALLEENEEGGGGGYGGLLELEDNVEEALPGADSDSDSSTVFSDDEDDEKAEQERAMLDDSRWVPEPRDGCTTVALPPRNYILVQEDGRLHKKDDFEPMSFGMQRIHNDTEPEPIWVQTKTARWLQTLVDLTIIPHTVPKELCRGSEIKVSFARRQVHVQAVRSKQIYMAGEVHSPINPHLSTWTTDGSYITITCVKENLNLYNGARGQEADTHWPRLFVTDQFVERGMIDANYYDLPEHMKRRNKMSELARKDKEEKEKQANLCPICNKDVRFFCECRTYDKDYERPLPQGWKDSQLGFSDNYEKYSLAEPGLLKQRPPSPPRPYQGRPAPKYGLDGKGQDEDEPRIKMLTETA
jgi:tetratricopeptide (TPR) repeat protein